MDLKKAPFYLSEKQEKEVEATLREMPLEKKAGQVFCVLGELYDEAALKDMVANKGLGGILFRPCDKEYLKKRFAPLDAVAEIPLLKAANMEAGGSGAVSDGTRFGNQMQIAATDDAVWAERLGLSCVAEGKPAGINWTFSPVSDIDMNYRNPITNTRTYGSDAARVRKMTLAYMKAVQENGVAACAKHFPGDGVDYRDHHLHPTVNSLSAKEWYESYGSIYKNMIDHNLLSIMAGHGEKKSNPGDDCCRLRYDFI